MVGRDSTPAFLASATISSCEISPLIASCIKSPKGRSLPASSRIDLEPAPSAGLPFLSAGTSIGAGAASLVLTCPPSGFNPLRSSARTRMSSLKSSWRSLRYCVV